MIVSELSIADAPRNVALSNAIGWPDTEPEWQVIHSAGYVLGALRAGGGELVAQGALGLCEGAGTIAKMVVAASARRQGLGAAILDRLLSEADRRALPVVGLIATPLGEPLYVTRGFEPLGEVIISVGTPRLDEHAPSAPALQVRPVTDAPQILSIERRFMAGSRAGMLRARLACSSVTALTEGGYALATPQPGGTRIGPIIAENVGVARALACALFRAAPGLVRLDVPGEQREFRDWLISLGMVEKGVHREMSRGGAVPWNVPQRFCQATQAWG